MTEPAGDLTPLEAEIVKTSTELVKSEKGLNQLERILNTQFTPEKIQKYIQDLCEAEDTRMTAAGPITTPNWEARKNGLDRVLSLLRYTKKDGFVEEKAPAKIVFIINNNSVEIPKETKSE